MNNPTAIALHEAKRIWPNTPIQCIVSCGTGKVQPVKLDPKQHQIINMNWKTRFFAILDSATDTEGLYVYILSRHRL